MIEAFYDFLGSFIPMKGKLQTAIHYVLNQKKELMTFLKDGRLEASNNRAERANKTVVIGRKNYLFSTSLAGAEANAIIYSVIETAKEHSLNGLLEPSSGKILVDDINLTDKETKLTDIRKKNRFSISVSRISII